MNILIIEDDDLKFGMVSDFLKSVIKLANVVRASSYQAGIESLVSGEFNIVVLDMTLPVSDLISSPVGTDFLTFGGELVLRECARRKVKTRIMVVTQYNTFVRDNKEVSFDELRDEIIHKYADLVLGCVRLERATDNWKSEIQKILVNEGFNN